MTITNHSFEDAANAPGYATLWSLEYGDDANNEGLWFFEPAAFHPTVIDTESYAKERFEDFWRLRRGLNIAGDFSVPYVWADIVEDAVSVYGTTHDGYVGQLSAIVESGIIPPGDTDPITVYLSYTNESEITGHSAEAYIPRGATQGTEYPFQLLLGDAGLKSIQNLTTSETLEPKIIIHGSQMLSPYNGDGLTEFTAIDITVFTIEKEDFEINWDDVVGAFSDNFDALNTEYGSFGSPTVSMETFEGAWHLPWTNDYPGNDWGVAEHTDTNEVRVHSFEPFVVSSRLNTGDAAFTITRGQNDRIMMRWSGGGTLRALDMTISDGAYTRTAMLTEIESVVDAALDVDGGNANSVHFDTYVNAGGYMCLETSFVGAGDKPVMELLDPPSDSAWGVLGFVTGETSKRTAESESVGNATFYSESDEERFESYWESNHLSQTAFAGSDITVATFYISKEHENFEEEWVLTL